MDDYNMTEEEAEKIEQEFLNKITNDPEFDLVDDGTLDTVIECAKCGEWLRFSDRLAALDFLESDRVCWRCPEEEQQ